MERKKELAGLVDTTVTEDDLTEINRLAKATLTAEQVYTFAVRLCDNEVDRDFERFDTPALEKLGQLFLGKSGIFDHQWSAGGQTARIYRTELCREAGVLTTAGDEVCYLKGYAYLLRSGKNADLIAEIEGGIKKEVSVGCSMTRSICSICGGEIGACAHQKGQKYGGALCYAELQEPVDAYEWSFVAVPAQRQAGVLKRYKKEGAKPEGQGAEWALLEKEAELGRKYLKALRSEVSRLALLADETLDGVVFEKIAGKLEEAELLELRRVYGHRVETRYHAEPQLRDFAKAATSDDANVFLV
ncbi:MAG: hypothetical protein RR295_00105 [Oscillospiraceae bacterium]